MASSDDEMEFFPESVTKYYSVDDPGEEHNGFEEEYGADLPFESVCSFCDDGGILVCCEGVCMRSFHGTRNAAGYAGSGCVSLGFSEREVNETPKFECRNCQHKFHQCFSCGQLGSSGEFTEVFQCGNATCGYFYHPSCVALILHRDSEVDARELEEKVLAKEAFTCPLHTCVACKQPEDKTDPELQMAVCRRCPKAYHRKCLPREIAFEDNENEGIVRRAWDGLLRDHRIMIYCLEHDILAHLRTPRRDHIRFCC